MSQPMPAVRVCGTLKIEITTTTTTEEIHTTTHKETVTSEAARNGPGTRRTALDFDVTIGPALEPSPAPSAAPSAPEAT